MNDYFTAIGPALASKINSAEGFIDMTHLHKVSPTISKVPFDQDKLLKPLNIINPSKTSAPDSISPRDFHLLCETMMNGLSTVFKCSLEEPTVPTQWKISRMHVIYKKGDASHGKLSPSADVECSQQAPRSNSMRRPGRIYLIHRTSK